MSVREKIPFKTDVTIRLEHPTDVVSIPKNPLDNTGDGSTCTFKVYDPAKNEAISSDEAIGQTVLSITNAAKFEVDDILEVTQNDDTLHSQTISAVDAAAGTVTIPVGLTVAADAGNLARVRLGSQVTMTEYGTPALGTLDWGFQGALAKDHAGLELDLEIDVEISFVGSVGGGLDLLEVLCLVIKKKEDCG